MALHQYLSQWNANLRQNPKSHLVQLIKSQRGSDLGHWGPLNKLCIKRVTKILINLFFTNVTHFPALYLLAIALLFGF